MIVGVDVAMRRKGQQAARPIERLFKDPIRAGGALDSIDGGVMDAGCSSGRPAGGLRQLWKRLERGSGLRGVRLAEIALRAGFTPPPPHVEPAALGRLEAALWMELARENAALRRQAAKLTERKKSLIRRIHRAKTRLQMLRLKALEQGRDAPGELARPTRSSRQLDVAALRQPHEAAGPSTEKN